MLLSEFLVYEDKSLSTHRHPNPKARKSDADMSAYLHPLLGVQFHANRQMQYGAKFAALQVRLQTKLEALVLQYDRGRLGHASLLDRASYVFQSTYLETFKLGVKSADMSGVLLPHMGKGTVVTAADRYWVASAARKELSFFKAAIGKRKDWKHSVRTRTAMYGSSLQSTYDAGRIVGLPSLMAIEWQVDYALENCKACLWLANAGPWTKDTLPTQPRAGETPCLFNCGCSLRNYQVHEDDYAALAGKGNRNLIRQQLKLMR